MVSYIPEDKLLLSDDSH